MSVMAGAVMPDESGSLPAAPRERLAMGQEREMTRSSEAPAETSPADPDVALMQRVAEDDAVAFEELLVKWQGRLVTLFWHQTGDHATAEDLAQEVFLRVFRSRRRYKATARFSTWLYTIANNVASDLRQRAYRRREHGAPPTSSASQSMVGLESLAVAASGEMPSRMADRQELLGIVQQALATLNDNQRMAVLLAKFEHCSQEEIAAAMGLSVPAVKSLLFRARDNLRTALATYLDLSEDSRGRHAP